MKEVFMRLFRRSVILCLLALCLMPLRPAFAQSNATDAALEGYVRDADGGALPGAAVVVRSLHTNIATSATTDERGYYRFSLLQIGEYELAVTLDGFGDFHQTGVVLNVGRQVRVDVRMAIRALQETVTVVADAAVADASQVAIQAVVNERAVRTLPIVSRNLYNLSLQAPGVKGLPSSGFGTTQLLFGGTNRSTWSADGLDNTSRAGSKQIRLVINTPESVEEMQTVSSGFSAEFGRAAGGLINIITRSGANQLHGSAMAFDRPNSWSARPPLAATKPDEAPWNMLAATLGGPVRRDRVFFFGQYEYNPYVKPSPVTITPANAAALGLTAEQVGNAPFGETFHTALAKLTFQPNPRNSGFIRYSRFTNDSPANGSGGLTVVGRSVLFTDRMFGIGGQLATTVSPNLRNELRVGFNRRSQLREPENNPAPDAAFINVTGVANFGGNPLSVTSSVEASTQVVDNVSYTRGLHFIKAGIDYQTTTFDNVAGLTRQFVFQGLAPAPGRGAVSALDQYLSAAAGRIDPATGRPYNYSQLQQSFGERETAKRFGFANVFAQDEIRLSPRLTVNAGLRYEFIVWPELDPLAPYELSRTVPSDGGNIAPRIGVSFLPTGDTRTVIRGGYGIYYDTPSLGLALNAAQSNGRRLLDFVIPGSDPAAPQFPNYLSGAAQSFAVKPSITAFASSFQIMYAHQANVQLERELRRDLSLKLQYSFLATRDGVYSHDVNLGPAIGTLPDGRPIYQGNANRPDPRFAAINLFESASNSRYHGVDVGVLQRFTHGVQLSATYGWGTAQSAGEQDGSAISDPSNLDRDYGRRNGNLTHSFVGNGMWSVSSGLLRNFDFSATVFYNSGFPVNVASGIDLNKDLVLNDRPLDTPRNSVDGPDYLQADVRITRRFVLGATTLAVIVESENLFNRFNASCSTDGGCTGAVVNVATAADFGRVTSARNARTVQAGARITF
jgi:hypothetical protein